MNLSFLPNVLTEVCKRAQILLKRSRIKEKLVIYIDKVYYAPACIYKKHTACTSCVFNGFKYVYNVNVV